MNENERMTGLKNLKIAQNIHRRIRRAKLIKTALAVGAILGGTNYGYHKGVNSVTSNPTSMVQETRNDDNTKNNDNTKNETNSHVREYDLSRRIGTNFNAVSPEEYNQRVSSLADGLIKNGIYDIESKDQLELEAKTVELTKELTALYLAVNSEYIQDKDVLAKLDVSSNFTPTEIKDQLKQLSVKLGNAWKSNKIYDLSSLCANPTDKSFWQDYMNAMNKCLQNNDSSDIKEFLTKYDINGTYKDVNPALKIIMMESFKSFNTNEKVNKLQAEVIFTGRTHSTNVHREDHWYNDVKCNEISKYNNNINPSSVLSVETSNLLRNLKQYDYEYTNACKSQSLTAYTNIESLENMMNKVEEFLSQKYEYGSENYNNAVAMYKKLHTFTATSKETKNYEQSSTVSVVPNRGGESSRTTSSKTFRRIIKTTDGQSLSAKLRKVLEGNKVVVHDVSYESGSKRCLRLYQEYLKKGQLEYFFANCSDDFGLNADAETRRAYTETFSKLKAAYEKVQKVNKKVEKESASKNVTYKTTTTKETKNVTVTNDKGQKVETKGEVTTTKTEPNVKWDKTTNKSGAKAASEAAGNKPGSTLVNTKDEVVEKKTTVKDSEEEIVNYDYSKSGYQYSESKNQTENKNVTSNETKKEQSSTTTTNKETQKQQSSTASNTNTSKETSKTTSSTTNKESIKISTENSNKNNSSVTKTDNDKKIEQENKAREAAAKKAALEAAKKVIEQRQAEAKRRAEEENKKLAEQSKEISVEEYEHSKTR